ncbi:MAG: HEAT repeat domain-containing protein [bacterium]
MNKALAVVCGLAMIAGTTQAQRSRGAATPNAFARTSTAVEDPGDSLYRLGRQAVTDNDYRRASGLFKQVVDKYPSSQSVGEALYWNAWALYHLGVDRRRKPDLDEALASIERQRKAYPKAAAADDDLLTRIRSAQARLGDPLAAGDIADQARKLEQPGRCSGADDEIRMAALQGLMSMNSDDAMPILKQVLSQRDPCRVQLRKTAVYLIATRKGDDVVTSLLDVARNDPSVEVQSDAIYYLSTTHSDRATTALDSILFSGHDTELRNKAVYALSQLKTERAGQVLRRAAQDDKLPDEVRGQATYWLGESRLADLDFFRALYKSTKSDNVHGQIIQAIVRLRTPEATRWLIDMAKDKNLDAESRKNAIYWAGQQQVVDMTELNSIYDQARGDDDVQKQVLYVYSTRKETAAVDKLMAIAKSDQNIEMRKQALYWLGTKNDPRVKQFILDLIIR